MPAAPGHQKIHVSSLATRAEYLVVRRLPRNSWELPLYCVLGLYHKFGGWIPLTAWVALDDNELAEFIEFAISDEIGAQHNGNTTI